MRLVRSVLALLLLILLLPAYGQTPKRGGILNAMQAEDLPAGFSIHETSSPEVDDLIDRQSREIDPKKRFELVLQIQRKLEADVAKPILGWRFGYCVQWPHVKNLVPHHVIYNYARMQEVWLDR